MKGLVPFRQTGISRNRAGFDDFYNMLDDFFSDAWLPRRMPVNTFRMDIQENDEEYCVEAELPGVKKEEINITEDDGRVTITVNREQTSEETEKNFVHRERSVSSMQRSIYLGDITADGIKAKLDNGVLRLNISKQKRADKPNNIVIE